MKWYDISKFPPPINERLNISFGLFGIRGAVCDDWISTGFIDKNGRWTIRWKEGMPKYQNPTHWSPITCNKSCSPSDFKEGGKCDINGCYKTID
jgi:hypothetical protein